jgi:hypothetical protein
LEARGKRVRGNFFPGGDWHTFIAGAAVQRRGGALVVLRGGEGWGLGVGTTRVTVDVALLLDLETGEVVGVDMWDPGTVTGDDCLFWFKFEI